MIKYIYCCLFLLAYSASFAQVEVSDKVAVQKDELRMSSVKEAFELSAKSDYLKLAEEADEDLHSAIITRDITRLLGFYDKLLELEDKTGREPKVFSNLSLLSQAGSWIQKNQKVDNFELTSLIGFAMDNSSTKSVLKKLAKMQETKAMAMPAPAPPSDQSGASSDVPVYELQIINRYKEPIV